MIKRVVVTGMGIVSPLGSNIEEAYKNAINGKNGIKEITSFDVEELEVKIGAPVSGFDPLKYLTKRDLRRQDLFSQYAVYASMEAFEDAKLKDQVDPEDIGVLIGTGMGGMQTFAKDLNTVFSKGYRRMPPMFIPMIIPNMAAGNVSIALNAKNHTSTVTTACAAGSHAIGDAFRHIKYGHAKVMVAGGSEAGLSPYTLAGFNALTALSTNPNPNKASRPFDLNRDGFVLGEGAGILILEEYDHAKKRNAKIYAEVVGYGSTSDAYHITAPSCSGATKSINMALAEANLKASDVTYINAHGTSTPLNDKYETIAIKEAFGDSAYNVSISSTKSMHGHALGGTGGIEAVLSVLTTVNDIIPPTINLDTPDPDCDLDYTPNVAKERKVDVAMSTSLGFGGHNAVIIFKKVG